MKKVLYDLFLCFKDIKAYEKTKTLKKDKKENLNNKLLTFMVNNY